MIPRNTEGLFLLFFVNNFLRLIWMFYLLHVYSFFFSALSLNAKTYDAFFISWIVCVMASLLLRHFPGLVTRGLVSLFIQFIHFSIFIPPSLLFFYSGYSLCLCLLYRLVFSLLFCVRCFCSSSSFVSTCTSCSFISYSYYSSSCSSLFLRFLLVFFLFCLLSLPRLFFPLVPRAPLFMFLFPPLPSDPSPPPPPRVTPNVLGIFHQSLVVALDGPGPRHADRCIASVQSDARQFEWKPRALLFCSFKGVELRLMLQTQGAAWRAWRSLIDLLPRSGKSWDALESLVLWPESRFFALSHCLEESPFGGLKFTVLESLLCYVPTRGSFIWVTDME